MRADSASITFASRRGLPPADSQHRAVVVRVGRRDCWFARFVGYRECRPTGLTYELVGMFELLPRAGRRAAGFGMRLLVAHNLGL